MQREPIYVELRIRGSLDDLWRLTQRPGLHRRWDLRFSEIEYLARAEKASPQRFRYVTGLGFGLTIKGLGESRSSCEGRDGARTSALRFWSDDSRSLIAEGSGYWRYIPTEDGIRFLTRFDYETRFGSVGRVIDALLFRPLFGWATAWSFDRLRLWIEEGVPPESSLRHLRPRARRCLRQPAEEAE